MQEFKYIASYEILVATVLKHLRQYAQGGQIDVAKISDIPKSTLSRLESGEAKLTVEYLVILCNVYNIKTSEFFGAVEVCTEYLQTELATLIRTERKVLNPELAKLAFASNFGLGLGLALSLNPVVYLAGSLITAAKIYKNHKNKESIGNENLEKLIDSTPVLSQQDLLKICHTKLSEYWIGLEKKRQMETTTN